MGILRWLLTISIVGILLVLGLLLGVLLLGVYLAMRVTGALKTVAVRVDERGQVVTPDQGRAPVPQPRATQTADLPLAPAGVDVLHMRAWDELENRAVDRWYYKDESGQWIFVRAPVRT